MTDSEKIDKITELLYSEIDNCHVIDEVMKVLGIEVEREPFIPYGKVADINNEQQGWELWSEPITDAIDGLVLKNEYGSIIVKYIQNYMGSFE